MRTFSKSIACVAASVCIALNPALTRGDFVIDDFDSPNPQVSTVINLVNPDPTLIETPDAAILGGERDLLLDVLGAPGAVSHTGTVGEGTLVFNSEQPGTTVILQYDGVDQDPANALANAEGLTANLAALGTYFYLDFLNMDRGTLAVNPAIQIRVNGAAGSAVFDGTLPESAVPYRYIAPFAAFVGDDVFGSATSIEVQINGAGNPAVDFALDTIGIPEPTTMTLLALGAVTLLKRRRQA